MAKSLLTLAREVSARRGDLILATPSSNGSQTTLVSAALGQYLPQSINQFYPWVYGTSTGTGAVDTNNRGVERRATSWSFSNTTLTLPSPGFPSAVTTGTYEIRRGKSRDRVVEALNDALGEIDWYVTREFKDETLTGTSNTWRYTLPASQNWERVTQVEIQASLTYLDYPYRPARDYGLAWRSERTTDTTGNTVWTIQFNSQPPPGFIIRVWGEGYYTEFVNEADVLPVPAEYERRVIRWMYDWALFFLDRENAEAWATGDSQKAMANRESNLQRVKKEMLEGMKAPKPGRINTPLSRVGTMIEDARFLGAFTSGGLSGTPFNPAL